MNFLTQSNLSPGNCWQTVMACILEVDPAELPDQVAVELGGRYMNPLNAYLEKHHNGLMYVCLQDHEWGGVNPPDGPYLWEGPTVRTPTNQSEHVVIALGRAMVWDPHPSRDGLTEVKRWGVLTKAPKHILEWKARLRADPASALGKDLACVCPACRSLSTP